MVNINQKIADVLKLSKDSVINSPIKINNEWYLIQRENFIPATYNQHYKNQICMELFEKELEKEYEKKFLNLIKVN